MGPCQSAPASCQEFLTPRSGPASQNIFFLPAVPSRGGGQVVNKVFCRLAKPCWTEFFFIYEKALHLLTCFAGRCRREAGHNIVPCPIPAPGPCLPLFFGSSAITPLSPPPSLQGLRPPIPRAGPRRVGCRETTPCSHPRMRCAAPQLVAAGTKPANVLGVWQCEVMW